MFIKQEDFLHLQSSSITSKRFLDTVFKGPKKDVISYTITIYLILIRAAQYILSALHMQ